MTEFFYIGAIAGLGFFIGVLTLVLVARGCGVWFSPFGKWATRHGMYLSMYRMYDVSIFGWHPFVRVGLRYWVRSHQFRRELADDIRELQDEKDVGFYNGIEMALALLEQRTPDLRMQEKTE